MKIALIIIGFFGFAWWVAPFLFHAMAESDFRNLQNGIRDAKIRAGSYVDQEKVFESYEDKYMRGKGSNDTW